MGKERSFVCRYARRYHYFSYTFKGDRKIKYPKTAGKWLYEEYVIVAEDQEHALEIFNEAVEKMPFSLPARIQRDIENGNGCVEVETKDLWIKED